MVPREYRRGTDKLGSKLRAITTATEARHLHLESAAVVRWSLAGGQVRQPAVKDAILKKRESP